MIYDFGVNFNFLNIFNAEKIDLILPIGMIYSFIENCK